MFRTNLVKDENAAERLEDHFKTDDRIAEATVITEREELKREVTKLEEISERLKKFAKAKKIRDKVEMLKKMKEDMRAE